MIYGQELSDNLLQIDIYKPEFIIYNSKVVLCCLMKYAEDQDYLPSLISLYHRKDNQCVMNMGNVIDLNGTNSKNVTH